MSLPVGTLNFIRCQPILRLVFFSSLRILLAGVSAFAEVVEEEG